MLDPDNHLVVQLMVMHLAIEIIMVILGDKQLRDVTVISLEVDGRFILREFGQQLQVSVCENIHVFPFKKLRIVVVEPRD